MNLLYDIGVVIILTVVVFSINMAYARNRIEKHLVDLIVKSLGSKKRYDTITPDNIKIIALEASKEMHIRDRIIAIFPLNSDSESQKAAYSKKLYNLVGKKFKE